MNEIKLIYNGDVLIGNIEFDMHMWAIMGDRSSTTGKTRGYCLIKFPLSILDKI